MKKKEKSIFILNKLEDLYPEPEVPLYHLNPFTLLIAVLLSAQTTDKKVNEKTPSLFNKASTPYEMSKLSENEILIYIKEIGLAPKKSRYIKELSQLLITKFKGLVPCDYTDLESLPGVGHKTASVVMAQAFGEPSFPVDTHIHRLSQRWGLSSGKSVKETETNLKKLFPKNKWNNLHLQIIYYGREFCTARGCDGRQCYICRKIYPNRTKPFRHKKA